MHKPDRNHAHVRDTLRELGFHVTDLARAGDGVPDLLVSRWGLCCPVEVKFPGCELTPKEAQWWEDFKAAGGDGQIAWYPSDVLGWFRRRFIKRRADLVDEIDEMLDGDGLLLKSMKLYREME